MEIRALKNNVLVKILPFVDRKYKNIIHIPDGARREDATYVGIVDAFGKGFVNKKGKLIPVDLSLGDKVLFPRFVGVRVSIDGVEYRFIKVSDVIAIIEE
jgi:chaperonin GroES